MGWFHVGYQSRYGLVLIIIFLTRTVEEASKPIKDEVEHLSC